MPDRSEVLIDASGLNLLVFLVDLGVIAFALFLLGYAWYSGALSRKLLPAHGGVLIVTGILLAFVVQIFDIGLELHSGGEEVQTRHLLAEYLSSDWAHWISSRVGFLMIAAGLLVAVIARSRSETEYLDTRRELEVSKFFEYQAEERFRYLFDSTSNSVYCYRFDPPVPIDSSVEEQIKRSYDAILQDCNVIFARELGADDPTEVIGGRLGDLDSAKDTAAHEAYFRTFVEGDYRLDGYDLNYRAPAGDSRAVYMKMVGIVRDGLLHRMWAIENNVLDLQQTKAALRHRRMHQKLVASVSSRLVMADDERADAAIKDCMKDICNFVAADRSTLFWIDSESNVADVVCVWGPERNPFGAVPMDQFPEFGKQLRALESVRIDDVAQLPERYRADRKGLEKYDLKSLAIMPLIVSGETVGGITYGCLKEQKAWLDQEIEDLRVFAELLANFVLRLKSRRALREAMADLEVARERLEAENVYLREEIELTHGFDEIIGQSDAVLRSLQLVEQVAPTKTPVLIMGETGTGKELVARAIHELSDRCDRPLVKVNCAALPANLIESELFGHEKGAFTGADRTRRGRFDLAAGSTLFLDEIGEIPVELQAKLLRVLQEGEFDRLGGGETIKVDVRVVVATNRNLAEAVQQGEFRSDLYYRINTFPIEMPPLRDRGDDIQLLAEHFVKVHSQRLGREINEISAAMMRQLRDYPWPGNVRELEGIIQRALISSRGPVLDLIEPLLNGEADHEDPLSASGASDLKLIEREHIVAVLEDANWKISGATGAASKLGIPPSTLRSKMKKLDIVRPG